MQETVVIRLIRTADGGCIDLDELLASDRVNKFVVYDHGYLVSGNMTVTEAFKGAALVLEEEGITKKGQSADLVFGNINETEVKRVCDQYGFDYLGKHLV